MNSFQLPDLCRNSSLLVVIIVSQLSALCIYLFLPESLGVSELAQILFYALILAVFWSAGLCLCRAWIAKQNYIFGFGISWLMMVVVVVLVEIGFQSIQADHMQYVWQEVAKRALAGGLLAILVLRFFQLLSHLDRSSRAEAESRVLALQSRIQPHFLFNSLNTISELAFQSPEKAEQATVSLSALFRASLENERRNHSLAQEISLCKKYLKLERFRMGDSLLVAWNIAVEDSGRWTMPKLMLQPLVENALVHGIQEDGRVSLRIDVRESNKHISILVENSLGQLEAKQQPKRKGHGIAIDNIKQRLDTLFDDQYTFKTKQDSNSYSVLMRIPKHIFTSEVIR